MMLNQVITGDNFAVKWQRIKNSGINNLRIVSDFDRTLTQAFVNDQPTFTSFSILQQPGLLSDHFQSYTQQLFQVYRPIELASDMDDLYKIQKMEEWWTLSLQALIDERIHRDTIFQVARSDKFIWRKGVISLLQSLQQTNVPFSIFSSGIGDVIKAFLEHQQLLHQQIDVIANYLEYDDLGYATKYLIPVLHAANKNELTLKARKEFEDTFGRNNVLLFGDQLGDAEMSQDNADNCVLRVGFLNEQIEANLASFIQTFDVVITGDDSFDFVNNLLVELN